MPLTPDAGIRRLLHSKLQFLELVEYDLLTLLRLDVLNDPSHRHDNGADAMDLAIGSPIGDAVPYGTGAAPAGASRRQCSHVNVLSLRKRNARAHVQVLKYPGKTKLHTLGQAEKETEHPNCILSCFEQQP
jgi:hypothetical protein